MRLLLKSIVDFFRDDGPLYAGSISYFFVMAIVPFSLILIAILGHILGENRELYDFFLKRLLSFFPAATNEITKTLGKIITYKSIGVLTLALYAVFSYQLYFAVERALNVIFKISTRRHALLSILLSLLMITLMIIFVIISFAASSVISMIKYIDPFFPNIELSQVSRFIIRFVIPLLLIFMTTTSLYIFLPKRTVRIRHAIIGSLFTSLFLETAKHLFTFYVASELYQLGAIYGPISAFITFLLWIFYSACIFLIGAEIAHNLGSYKEA